MCSGRGDGQLRPPGFPIRKSPDHSLVADSPGLIAGSNVLHRLLVPRHPPCALINLATTIDARVHYAVLKIRAAPRQNPTASAVRCHGPRETKAYARSLRTQQRAKPRHRRRRRSAPRRRRTSRPCRISSQLASAPRARRPGTSARETALGTPPAKGRRARCSLERR
jgi:hypothetical protein